MDTAKITIPGKTMDKNTVCIEYAFFIFHFSMHIPLETTPSACDFLNQAMTGAISAFIIER